ncbi:NPCBM/NEW2 domain protein [Pseudobythopirellula maris]|uniref:NPCBM/NEW2 domain protein n=1 Tax=Pseudobythopirellula maris TaxID=2527991 RepID=A0A5C5ZIS6_9BACT|nr:NPCBM/NEW2 domain-containing protein [Pseudobythopirellula maris]TWT87264.1 NPCBM/NEW2 domain protein [Pseudobythopirellula maris]
MIHRTPDAPALLVLVLCSLFSPSAASAETHRRDALLRDGRTVESARLVAWSEASGLMLRLPEDSGAAHEGDDPPAPLGPLRQNDLVRWGRPPEQASTPHVLLADGSRVTAADSWEADGSVRLDAHGLWVRTELFGELAAPRATVRWIVFEAAREGTSAAQLADSSHDQAVGADRVYLVGGDRLDGRIVAVDGGAVSLAVGASNSESAPVQIALERVLAVRLNGAGAPATPAACAVGFADGSLLLAERVSVEPDGASLSVAPSGLADPLAVEAEASDVTFLQPLSGDAVTYLSDLKPVDYQQPPYFDLSWRLGADKNLRGEPLSSGGERRLKGLAVHAASRLVYRVDPGQGLRFQCEVGVDDSAVRDAELAAEPRQAAPGSVVFRVYRIVEGALDLAHETPVIRGGEAPTPIDVDLAGAAGLVLVADFADRGDELDHADWLDARLVWVDETP